MNEQDIIKCLARDWDHKQRYDIMVPNCYTQHDNEADFFGIRKSGLCDEFEIKVSRSDFKADKNKFVNYRDHSQEEAISYSHIKWGDRKECPWYKQKHQALIDGDMAANYFWYVMPEGLIEQPEIPEFAGVIYVRTEGRHIGRLVKARSPKRLHAGKLTMEEQYKYARKNNYRFWDMFLSEVRGK